MKPCTGAQITMIMSLREQLGLKKLDNWSIKCLNINSASIMIEDLRTMKSLKDTLDSLTA